MAPAEDFEAYQITELEGYFAGQGRESPKRSRVYPH
jgi:hypothetical protein